MFLLSIASAIAGRFSMVEQSFYYTFLSIAGLQSLFEMGFGQVVTQNVAHVHGRLKNLGGANGNQSAGDFNLLTNLLKFSEIYYSWISAIFIIIVGIGGHLYFQTNPSGKQVDWQISWWLFIISTGVTVRNTRRLAVLEGFGCINWIVRNRLYINLGRNVITLSLILNDVGLVALSCGVAFYCLCTWVCVEKEYHRQLIIYNRENSKHKSDRDSLVQLWHKLWPMQSRLALSYLAGFFIFAATTPILLTFCGPDAAARFGITWTLLQGVSGIAIAWNSTKAAVYGRLAGEKDFEALWQKWSKTLLQSLGVCVCGLTALGVYVGVIVPWMGVEQKFLSVPEMIPLMVASSMSVIGYAMAIYARSQLHEIFAPASLVSGFTSVVFVALAAIYLSIAWVPWAYLAASIVSSFVAFPTFIRFRRRQSLIDKTS